MSYTQSFTVPFSNSNYSALGNEVETTWDARIIMFTNLSTSSCTVTSRSDSGTQLDCNKSIVFTGF